MLRGRPWATAAIWLVSALTLQLASWMAVEARAPDLPPAVRLVVAVSARRTHPDLVRAQLALAEGGPAAAETVLAELVTRPRQRSPEAEHFEHDGAPGLSC